MMESYANPTYELGTVPVETALDKRVCSFQHTYINLCEFNPNINMLTYDYEKFYCTSLLLLLKMVMGLGKEPMWLGTCDVEQYFAANIPGGLKSTGIANGIHFSIECYPLVTDRELDRRKGGMAVRIKADKAPVSIKCCTGELNTVMCYYTENIESTKEMCSQKGTAELENSMLHLTSDAFPLHLYIHGNFTASIAKLPDTDENHGQYGILQSTTNELLLTVAFSSEQDQAREMAQQDTLNEIEKANRHYETIMNEWYTKTPDADIDGAFLQARLNLEYAWFRPNGWSESIHHWPAMWHVEHTYAEEWAGNTDRSREVFKATLDKLIDGDKVPEFSAPGFIRREWGGDNNYFFRCVDHYLKMTNDKDYARYLKPYMVKILNQTLREYDPTDSGVMAFGTQIGNQEDFEGTPGQGSASGIEGAYMLKVMSDTERMLGNNEEADRYLAFSQWRRMATYQKLWMKDMGRFAWYEDPLGQMRLDPAYHSICYPIIYGMMSDDDQVSSIDHLLHRLTGSQGEMYISNHFGGHCYHNVATWGMQCGANNQAFAALAYAKLGMNNQAIKSLKFIADITCNRLKDSFPETAREGFKSYFSPAAAVYAMAVIEGIFGLKRDLTKNETVIQPCFPDSWGHAEINLKEVNLQYEKKGSHHVFRGRFNDATNKLFTWRLAPYSAIKATLNGKKVEVNTTPRCGWFDAFIPLGSADTFELVVEYEPIQFALQNTGSVAEGSGFQIKATGAEIINLKDPCGIFSEISQDGNVLKVTTQDNLLTPYRRFGWFGLINFARRTFFVELRVNNTVFTYPSHITILPKYALLAKLEGTTLDVTVQRFADGSYHGDAVMLLAGEKVSVRADIESGEGVHLLFPLTSGQFASLLPGRNKVRVYMGSELYELYFEAETLEGKTAYSIPLDENRLKPATYWAQTGKFATAFVSTIYCNTPDNFLQDVFDKYKQLNVLPGVQFKLNKNGFLPVSAKFERNVTLDLKGKRARKLYVLLSAFITNQHAFTEPFRMELEAEKTEEYNRPVFTAKLNFPGDLDIGLSGLGMYGFPSYITEQERGILPPLPKKGDPDYPDALPPAYPQHYLWNQRRAFQVCETVFTVVEIEMDKERNLKELRITANDEDATAAIYAISAI